MANKHRLAVKILPKPAARFDPLTATQKELRMVCHCDQTRPQDRTRIASAMEGDLRAQIEVGCAQTN